jgi:hypothetical protein
MNDRVFMTDVSQMEVKAQHVKSALSASFVYNQASMSNIQLMLFLLKYSDNTGVILD